MLGTPSFEQARRHVYAVLLEALRELRPQAGGANVTQNAPLFVGASSLEHETSCMVTVWLSIPTISLMWVTRREPSRMRVRCTMRLMAETTCSRIALAGKSKPAISTMFSTRESASRGVLAWTVVSDPS
jgi:hypothetical protein